jgi:hypothetical protein
MRLPIPNASPTLCRLQAYDGRALSKPLLLALKGRVLDVTSGSEYYGPEGPYKLMAGRDASYAFAMMSLKAEDAHADLAGAPAGKKREARPPATPLSLAGPPQLGSRRGRLSDARAAAARVLREAVASVSRHSCFSCMCGRRARRAPQDPGRLVRQADGQVSDGGPRAGTPRGARGRAGGGRRRARADIEER